MKYKNIIDGTFIERPNRFIAMVEVKGEIYKCHVKNTGRCKELLIKGTRVFLEVADNKERKTKYSLVGVMKNHMMINMDSQAPNKIFKEYLEQGKLFKDIKNIKPEFTYGSSRIDFYVEYENKRALIEVKGVTLENEGISRFPDAPTERGIKHIKELETALEDGYESYVVFVIQMDKVKHFEPNDITHKAFGDALRKAKANGVNVLAFSCNVSEDEVTIKDNVEVLL